MTGNSTDELKSAKSSNLQTRSNNLDGAKMPNVPSYPSSMPKITNLPSSQQSLLE